MRLVSRIPALHVAWRHVGVSALFFVRNNRILRHTLVSQQAKRSADTIDPDPPS